MGRSGTLLTTLNKSDVPFSKEVFMRKKGDVPSDTQTLATYEIKKVDTDYFLGG